MNRTNCKHQLLTDRGFLWYVGQLQPRVRCFTLRLKFVYGMPGYIKPFSLFIRGGQYRVVIEWGRRCCLRVHHQPHTALHRDSSCVPKPRAFLTYFLVELQASTHTRDIRIIKQSTTIISSKHRSYSMLQKAKNNRRYQANMKVDI